MARVKIVRKKSLGVIFDRWLSKVYSAGPIWGYVWFRILLCSKLPSFKLDFWYMLAFLSYPVFLLRCIVCPFVLQS